MSNLSASAPPTKLSLRKTSKYPLNGYVEYTKKNGSHFAGYVKNGQKNGRGMMLYANGARFMGTYVNDRRLGRGRLILQDGTRFDGEFCDEAFEGWGRFEWEDYSVYGKRTGYGEFVYPSGDRFEGYWHEDERKGFGVYTFADGRKKIGIWEKSICVEEFGSIRDAEYHLGRKLPEPPVFPTPPEWLVKPQRAEGLRTEFCLRPGTPGDGTGECFASTRQRGSRPEVSPATRPANDGSEESPTSGPSPSCPSSSPRI